MDTLLKLSLNNEKDDEKNKEYASVDFVWLYAYVKVRISPVTICPIFTARCYASAVLAMGLCLSVSVSLSVTSRSSTKTTKRRIKQTIPQDSPRTLVF